LMTTTTLRKTTTTIIAAVHKKNSGAEFPSIAECRVGWLPPSDRPFEFVGGSREKICLSAGVRGANLVARLASQRYSSGGLEKGQRALVEPPHPKTGLARRPIGPLSPSRVRRVT
jgi:hypothetical protein